MVKWLLWVAFCLSELYHLTDSYRVQSRLVPRIFRNGLAIGRFVRKSSQSNR